MTAHAGRPLSATPWPLGASTGPTGDPFRDCVRCGLCLESCPTYTLHGDEAQSPRGRLILLDALREGRLLPTRDVVEPLESCLVCRSCETACPSGVRFGHLMETGRRRLHEDPQGRRAQPPWRRAVSRLLLRGLEDPKGRLRLARLARRLQDAGLFRRIEASPALADAAPWIRSAASLMPRLSDPFVPAPETEGRPDGSGTTGTVLVFSGCVTPWAFPEASRAVDRVARRLARQVVYPAGQVCCGALHLHHGDHEGAVRLARKNLLAFATELDAPIIAEAAGCGAALKSYPELLRDVPLLRDQAERFSARVRDFSEWVIASGPPRGERRGVRVVFQDPCHLFHVQRVRDAPRRLLADVAGMTIVEAPEREICCGSAGITNLLQPDDGRRLGERKADALSSARPDLVVTSNPGCLLQLRRHMPSRGVPVRHLAEALDAHWPDDGPSI